MLLTWKWKKKREEERKGSGPTKGFCFLHCTPSSSLESGVETKHLNPPTSLFSTIFMKTTCIVPNTQNYQITRFGKDLHSHQIQLSARQYHCNPLTTKPYHPAPDPDAFWIPGSPTCPAPSKQFQFLTIINFFFLYLI